MSEDLPPREQIVVVETDSWDFQTPETGKLLQADGNSCVITIIHFPGRVTYMGHYSLADPEATKPENSNTQVTRTLKSMFEIIAHQAKAGRIDLSQAQAHVLGGSSADEIDRQGPGFSQLVQENAEYSLDLLTELGLTTDQITTQRLSNDKQFRILADPLTGEVTQEITDFPDPF